MATIRRVGVIGAGVMGSGIAAHLANASIRVELLDIVPFNLSDEEKKQKKARNRLADDAVKASKKGKPTPAFYHSKNAALVRTGNLDDDFDRLAECDLIIEAVIERLDIKQKLFERLEKVIGSDTIVASNTSGLRIVNMLEGRSEGFRSRFMVMHFFNPVRHMKLLELVLGPETRNDVAETIATFGRDMLGKGIVYGFDTPNFVGNRIGCHSMMFTIHRMLDEGLGPEDVDLITGKAMAHPKSASFQTADLVGLDTFIHVAKNCYEALTEDEDREVFKIPAFIETMAEKKLLGNKTKAGFYRRGKDGFDVFDPKTLEYRAKAGDPNIREVCKAIQKIEDPRERVRKLVADDGAAGKFAWTVLSHSLAYSARRIGEIADNIVAVDDAMRWGYNWELGPFEVWDALGFKETAERMKADGIALPESIEKMLGAGVESFYGDGRYYDVLNAEYKTQETDPKAVPLTVMRKDDSPVLKNDGAEAWDLGDGVLGFNFTTKMNVLDADVISLLGEATERAERDFRAMVIANEGEHFSLGANLFAIVLAANQKQWDQLRGVVQGLQTTLQGVKYARVPVVAAPFGRVFGGGLEVCLASDAVQVAAETYAGLVEVGVGLIPGGCGNLNLLWRALEGIPEGANVNTYEYVTQVFKNIALAKVCLSAQEGKALGYFRHNDGVTFDRTRIVTEAKAKAIGLAEAGYHPPLRRAHRLPGESGIATLAMMVDTLQAGGYATEHDGTIARKLAEVLCGGVGGASREVTEDEMLELEREAFVSLCGEQKSIDRMQHMLTTKKPLRN
ncbi:MAG: 3-hydroxyacyl-CoA dehydrogenase/enoyl-CoA hydratase family protein [Myxococcota bacterium]